MWILTGTFAYILFLLVCVLAYAIQYLTLNVRVESFAQLLYTMQVSMGGAENTINQILSGFFSQYWLLLVLGTAVFILYIRLCQRVRAEKEFTGPVRSYISIHHCRPLIKVTAVVCAAAMTFTLISQVKMGWEVLGVSQYLADRSQFSTLYEDHYVRPDKTLVTFPEQKKNLIYIFCESMETTFASPDAGGLSPVNLIPELTQLAQENQTFTAADSSAIGGARTPISTTWTVAGMVAQTAAVPLNSGNDIYCQNLANESEFLPNVTSLGNILEANGYRNMLMCGSDAAYAGRANYFSQHGNYEIFDLHTARSTGKVPEDYEEWWGFEDIKLFEYAQEALLDLASSDQPFNFTMLTADTHFSGGYLCPDCPDTHEERYENVIACSDHKIAEFVRWIQAQPFYENTTIVISGDHLSMDGYVTALAGDGDGRRTFVTVINGPECKFEENRDYTTLDLYPTTLEALGAAVEGGRLGLGTSLYSGERTLSEELGFDEFNHQLGLNSMYYDRVILQGDFAEDTEEE